MKMWLGYPCADAQLLTLVHFVTVSDSNTRSFSTNKILSTYAIVNCNSRLLCSEILSLFGDSYSIQRFLFCSEILILFRDSYSVRRFLLYSEIPILFRDSYSVQRFLLCSEILTLFIDSYSVHRFLLCSEILILLRDSYSVRRFLHFPASSVLLELVWTIMKAFYRFSRNIEPCTRLYRAMH